MNLCLPKKYLYNKLLVVILPSLIKTNKKEIDSDNNFFVKDNSKFKIQRGYHEEIKAYRSLKKLFHMVNILV